MPTPKKEGGGYVRITVTEEALRRPAVKRATIALIKAMQSAGKRTAAKGGK